MILLHSYSRNNLSTLPPSLCSLPALSSLKLDHNKLTRLPDQFGNLVKLEELDVSHNTLTALPGSVGELPCLLRLSASHNQLATVPESVGHMTSMLHMSCTICSNELHFLLRSGCTVLKELILNNNKLTALPASMCVYSVHTLVYTCTVVCFVT